MNKSLIIAWHHLAGALKSKVFWVSLLTAPLMMIVSIFLMNAANKAEPTLTFGLIDQTQSYQKIVDREMEVRHLRQFLFDFSAFFQKHKLVDYSSQTNQSEAHQRAADILEKLARREQGATQLVLDIGGFEQFYQISRDFMQDTAPQYIPPEPRIKQIALNTVTDDDTLSLEQTTELLKPHLLGKPLPGTTQSLDALVVVKANVNGSEKPPQMEYWSTNLTNSSISDLVRDAINQSIQGELMTAAGIDTVVLEEIRNTNVDVQQFNPKKESGKEERTFADFFKIGVPFAFAVILFMVFLISGGVILQGVIEEKSNKLIEVFLSSVTPGQLMIGKLLGVASVSLLVIFGLISVAIVAGFVGVSFMDSSGVANRAEEAMQTANVTSQQMESFIAGAMEVVQMVPLFIFCFVCGYIIFASLYLAVGSLCTSPQEANTLLTPLGIIMMIPMFMFGIVVRDPNGTIATVMTWFPLYTPVMVMMRMSGDPPMLEILGACVLLVVMTVLTVLVSVRIFRYGVLYSGETPKLIQLIRLMFSKKLSST